MRLKLMTICLFFIWISDVGALSNRKAFVIGNDSYPGSALRNARHDASSVAEALEPIGYTTTLLLDADRTTLIHAIDKFNDDLQPGDTVLFYYAGHGLQVGGENYLVPTDFTVTTPDDVRNRGYALSSLLERLTSHGATTQIIILDACRDNPFLGTRSTKGGWASLGTSAGTFLAFGTSPGSTASDDPAQPHGLFTMSLLKYLTSSQLDIEGMLRQVRLDVIRESTGHQVPWTASSLIGTLHILPELDEAAPPLAALPQITDLLPQTSENARSIPTKEGRGQANEGPNNASEYISTDAPRLLLQATKEIAATQFDSAVKTLQLALSVDPVNASALRMLGLVFQTMQRNVDAERALDRAIALNSGDAEAYVDRCLIRGGVDIPSAIADCEIALRLAPQSADAHLALANVLFAGGQTTQAYSEATRAIELSPCQRLGFAIRGRIAASLGYSGIAKQDYQRAVHLAISPDNSTR